MNLDDIRFQVGDCNGDGKRLVLAQLDEEEIHRSTVNTNSADSRRHFLKQLAEKIEADSVELVKRFDQRLIHLADQADAAAEADADSGDAEGGGEAGEERKSQATLLVDMVLKTAAELFHDPDGTAYARFAVDDHFEVARINTGAFKKWMARLYYEKTAKAPNSQAKADAAGVLEGKAIYEGPERRVFVRLGEHEGRIYLDLCNAKWQVVEIDAHGWRVVDECPIMFRRAKAMLPLPAPVRGGSLEMLERSLATPRPITVLVVAWLVGALRPCGPYPVLEFDGEGGSGKSTLARKLRCLVDPNTADLRSEPRDPRDLMIAASNGHIVAFDNLSFLHPWLSDCLCRLATGGGFSTRTLYENDDETIFNAQRPIILNGIEQVAARGDLIDRLLLAALKSIPDDERKPEAKIWKEFEEAWPALLGYLLTVVSTAIKNLPTTHVPLLPRMADFAVWIVAAEPAIGWAPGTFLAQYTGNREEADYLAIESSVVGKVLFELLEETQEWEGTATDLLRELERRNGFSETSKKPKAWPGNAKALSGAVKRVAPHLRKIGWECDSRRDEGRTRTRLIAFRKVRQSCVRSVQTVQDAADSPEIDDSMRTHADATPELRTQVPCENSSDRTQTDGSDASLPPLSAAGEGEIGEL